MKRIALINLPFAAIDTPSIALAQLESALGLERDLADRIECRVSHLTLDFVSFLGLDLYRLIADSVQANTSGLGDWFFRRAAFPDLPDDPEAYLARHFVEHRTQIEVLRGELTAKRELAGDLLDALIDGYGLDRCWMVGFTSMFSQNLACVAMARRLKERNPAVVTLMGGANCESPMGHVIARNVPWVDFVFSGPALRTFPHLVRCLLEGREDDAHRIPGIFSRRRLESGEPVPLREIGEEMDIDIELPLNYDGYFAELDEKLPGGGVEPKLPFETSRGCWWGERSHCTFCGLNGMTMKYRAMHPDLAVKLLQGLFDRYAARVSTFSSVDNILPREYLTEVLPRLDPPDHVSLFYEIKADLKEHEVETLARARVTFIQPGIEAISTSTLKLMRKGTTSFQNLKFLKHCRRYDVMPLWNLLVGFPEEPEEVYEKYCRDLPLLLHLQPPSGAYPVRFDRYSPYHVQAKEYGLKLRPCDFYEMIYPFPPQELEQLAYFFVDEDYEAAYAVQTARWLGRLRERIQHWQVRWNRQDGRLAPELAIRGRGAAKVVYDSRSGRAVEHRIGALGLRILGLLEEQHKLARLAEKLGDVPAPEVERQVASLQQRGLLFDEDGTYLSLVLAPPEPQAKVSPRSASLQAVT